MKKSNSGVYVDYVDHSNTSNEAGVISSTSKSDSLISVMENIILIYKHDITNSNTKIIIPEEEK